MTPIHLAVAAVLAASAGAPAAQGVPWTGKTVFCVKDNAEVEFGLRFDGRHVTFPFRGGMFLKVREDRGGRLRLHDGTNEGWADKADFVLMRDAAAHCTRRLEDDPAESSTLYWRACVHVQNRDYALAVADFDAYLKVNPAVTSALLARGDAWGHLGDRGRAIKDYDEVLRLDSTSASAYSYRACEWRAMKEYDRALKDYDEAIRVNPDYVGYRLSRAVTQMLMRRRAGLKGFRAVLDAPNFDNEVTPFAVIFGSLAARQVGDDEAARRFLADPAGDVDPEWPRPVVQFLRGEFDEPALLALAGDDGDKQTEARCSLGMDHALRGRPAEARAHFEWVRDRGNRRFTEYVVALAELDRLDRPAKAAKP